MNGEYKLSVPTEQKELLVTYMGYIDQVVKVNGRTVINIILKEDRKEMEEVVVTGYQSVRRERLTGSTKTITAREMEGKGLTSVEEALSSTVAGLNMISTGRPGQDAKIQIRGINSLNGSTEPIWIVDGMPMQGEIPNIKIGSADLQSTIFTSGIGNLSPNDIKSITVLKDAAATAIYGARAAN
ncbi:MAG: TonB-dependent receptor plug domain-containing protein, partial [Butyricimonas paravirosa]